MWGHCNWGRGHVLYGEEGGGGWWAGKSRQVSRYYLSRIVSNPGGVGSESHIPTFSLY